MQWIRRSATVLTMMNPMGDVISQKADALLQCATLLEKFSATK